MIEKIRPISNPLTVIAIFAAMAEVAGSVVLGVVTPSVQAIFVWYVMLFPASLVLMFFLTLWFKSDVLYAPKDFTNEENYMASRRRRADGLANDLAEVRREMESAVEKGATQVIAPIGIDHPDAASHQAAHNDVFFKTLMYRLNRAQARAEDLASDEGVNTSVFQPRYVRETERNQEAQEWAQAANVFTVLGIEGEATTERLAEILHIRPSIVMRELESLKKRGLVHTVAPGLFKPGPARP